MAIKIAIIYTTIFILLAPVKCERWSRQISDAGLIDTVPGDWIPLTSQQQYHQQTANERITGARVLNYSPLQQQTPSIPPPPPSPSVQYFPNIFQQQHHHHQHQQQIPDTIPHFTLMTTNPFGINPQHQILLTPQQTFLPPHPTNQQQPLSLPPPPPPPPPPQFIMQYKQPNQQKNYQQQKPQQQQQQKKQQYQQQKQQHQQFNHLQQIFTTSPADINLNLQQLEIQPQQMYYQNNQQQQNPSVQHQQLALPTVTQQVHPQPVQGHFILQQKPSFLDNEIIQNVVQKPISQPLLSNTATIHEQNQHLDKPNVPSQQQQQHLDEEVQLLYVPLNTLQEQYQQNHHKYPTFPPPVNPFQINNFYTSNLLSTESPVGTQFLSTIRNSSPSSTTYRIPPSTTTTTLTPVSTTIALPSFSTTPKPVHRFSTSSYNQESSKQQPPKSHQPPLAMFMSNIIKSEDDVSVNDILTVLKNAKSIDVLDAPSKKSPKIFVGPSELSPPDGYSKFDLPYLSNIEQNRSERQLKSLPFFVAPLSYKTPDGFAKIPLPSPHVGSVVVNTPVETITNEYVEQQSPVVVTTPKQTSYFEQNYHSTPTTLITNQYNDADNDGDVKSYTFKNNFYQPDLSNSQQHFINNINPSTEFNRFTSTVRPSTLSTSTLTTTRPFSTNANYKYGFRFGSDVFTTTQRSNLPSSTLLYTRQPEFSYTTPKTIISSLSPPSDDQQNYVKFNYQQNQQQIYSNPSSTTPSPIDTIDSQSPIIRGSSRFNINHRPNNDLRTNFKPMPATSSQHQSQRVLNEEYFNVQNVGGGGNKFSTNFGGTPNRLEQIRNYSNPNDFQPQVVTSNDYYNIPVSNVNFDDQFKKYRGTVVDELLPPFLSTDEQQEQNLTPTPKPKPTTKFTADITYTPKPIAEHSTKAQEIQKMKNYYKEQESFRNRPQIQQQSTLAPPQQHSTYNDIKITPYSPVTINYDSSSHPSSTPTYEIDNSNSFYTQKNQLIESNVDDEVSEKVNKVKSDNNVETSIKEMLDELFGSENSDSTKQTYEEQNPVKNSFNAGYQFDDEYILKTIEDNLKVGKQTTTDKFTTIRPTSYIQNIPQFVETQHDQVTPSTTNKPSIIHQSELQENINYDIENINYNNENKNYDNEYINYNNENQHYNNENTKFPNFRNKNKNYNKHQNYNNDYQQQGEYYSTTPSDDNIEYKLQSDLPPGLINSLTYDNEIKTPQPASSTTTTTTTVTTTTTERPTRRTLIRGRRPIIRPTLSTTIKNTPEYSESQSSVTEEQTTSRRIINRTRRPLNNYSQTSSSSSPSSAAANRTRASLVRNPNRVRYNPTPEERQQYRPRSRLTTQQDDNLEYQRDVLNQNYPVINRAKFPETLSTSTTTTTTTTPPPSTSTTTTTTTTTTEQPITIHDFIDTNQYDLPQEIITQNEFIQTSSTPKYNQFSGMNYDDLQLPQQEYQILDSNNRDNEFGQANEQSVYSSHEQQHNVGNFKIKHKKIINRPVYLSGRHANKQESRDEIVTAAQPTEITSDAPPPSNHEEKLEIKQKFRRPSFIRRPNRPVGYVNPTQQQQLHSNEIVDTTENPKVEQTNNVISSRTPNTNNIRVARIRKPIFRISANSTKRTTTTTTTTELPEVQTSVDNNFKQINRFNKDFIRDDSIESIRTSAENDKPLKVAISPLQEQKRYRFNQPRSHFRLDAQESQWSAKLSDNSFQPIDPNDRSKSLKTFEFNSSDEEPEIVTVGTTEESYLFNVAPQNKFVAFSDSVIDNQEKHSGSESISPTSRTSSAFNVAEGEVKPTGKVIDEIHESPNQNSIVEQRKGRKGHGRGVWRKVRVHHNDGLETAESQYIGNAKYLNSITNNDSKDLKNDQTKTFMVIPQQDEVTTIKSSVPIAPMTVTSNSEQISTTTNAEIPAEISSTIIPIVQNSTITITTTTASETSTINNIENIPEVQTLENIIEFTTEFPDGTTHSPVVMIQSYYEDSAENQDEKSTDKSIMELNTDSVISIESSTLPTYFEEYESTESTPKYHHEDQFESIQESTIDRKDNILPKYMQQSQPVLLSSDQTSMMNEIKQKIAELLRKNTSKTVAPTVIEHDDGDDDEDDDDDSDNDDDDNNDDDSNVDEQQENNATGVNDQNIMITPKPEQVLKPIETKENFAESNQKEEITEPDQEEDEDGEEAVELDEEEQEDETKEQQNVTMKPKMEYTNIERRKEIPKRDEEVITESKTSVVESSTEPQISSFHKDLMRSVIYATSTSTEVSHETEICYRGRCIKSNKMFN